MNRHDDTRGQGQRPGQSKLGSDKKMDMADLELNAVLRKTESGLGVIKLRDRALTPRQRMLLIMVDGVKTVGELSNPMPDPAQARQALAELLHTGYVSPVDLPKPVVKVRPEHKRSATEAPAESLKTAVQRTTRLLENMLGPTCEPLCLQLEKCTSFEQFTRKVQDFRRIVASMRSEKKADEFVSAALSA